MLLEHDSYKYPALALMGLAILFGYFKGRDPLSASGASRTWTYVPLMALAIASLGPSALAIMIYLGYTCGLLQPSPSGYRFSTFIQSLPVDFAAMNWPFAALYLVCRLRPNIGSARSAMWVSVVAMSLPNILLFSLAGTMVSKVYDAGQGIGIVEFLVNLPIIAMIWPGLLAAIPEAGSVIISALAAPIPLLGLIGWLFGQLNGWVAPKSGGPRPVLS